MGKSADIFQNYLFNIVLSIVVNLHHDSNYGQKKLHSFVIIIEVKWNQALKE